MDTFKQKTGKKGTKGVERSEEIKERRGDEAIQSGATAAQVPTASASKRGENQAEGHDPRPSAFEDAMVGLDTMSKSDQPTPGPSIGLVEPSAAVASTETVGERARSKTRPGPRSSKIRRGKEEKMERMGNRERSRSRIGIRSKEEEDRESEVERERKREKRAESVETVGSRSCGGDAADESTAGEPGPSRDDGADSDASSLSKEGEGWSTIPTPLVPKKRGPGRPPTHGEYVGLAATRRELAVAEERILELEAEREIAQSGISRHRNKRRGGERGGGKESGTDDPEATASQPEGPEEMDRRSVADLSRGATIAANPSRWSRRSRATSKGPI